MRAGLRGLAGLAANVADEAAGRVSTLRALQADVRGIEAADGTLGVLNARRSRVGPARARRTRSADRLRVRSPSDVRSPGRPAGQARIAAYTWRAMGGTLLEYRMPAQDRPIIHRPTDLESELIAAAPTTLALFCDVDGTLLPIAEAPDAVRVSDRVRRALGRLAQALEGAVALISGRRIDDLDRLFAPLHLPTAGLHGLERRDGAGCLHRLADAAEMAPLRPELRAFAQSTEGVLLEDKGATLALHYRGAPARAGELRALVARLVAGRLDRLRVLEGKMVIEIKPRVAHKGEAIAGFMGEPPFAGRRPVFLGDDLTDEDGFRVVNELGGVTVRVGDEGRSEARHRLANVEAVLVWLETLPETLSARVKG